MQGLSQPWVVKYRTAALAGAYFGPVTCYSIQQRLGSDCGLTRGLHRVCCRAVYVHKQTLRPNAVYTTSVRHVFVDVHQQTEGMLLHRALSACMHEKFDYQSAQHACKLPTVKTHPLFP